YFSLLGSIPEGFKGNPSSYADLKAAGVAVVGWGQFVTVLINFLILAFVIFLIVRAANRMRQLGEDTPAGPSEVDLLTEIRDQLKRRP
ncbi:MAG: MscL family protein, partial [Sphingomonas sp.]|uniref:MscL family protein n=1 Tax=Sphingomonas sp. TaxID=28214 RepID=UPI0017BA7706